MLWPLTYPDSFARLGVAVTLVEAGDRLLPGEDPTASEVLTAALRRDGVDVRTGSAPVRVTGDPAGGRLHLADGRDLVDGMSSWWAAIHGYRNPRLDQAMADQAGRGLQPVWEVTSYKISFQRT